MPKAPFSLSLVVAATCSLLLGPVHVHMAIASLEPGLPHEHVETTPIPASGRTIPVSTGGDFQAALNAAQPGDEIVLEAGGTFTGPFTLPRKRGTDWITIRSSSPKNGLPLETRADPSRATDMPKLVTAYGSVIIATPGAHHYRFVRIEIGPREGVFLYDLILLGYHETTVEGLPHHIIFDHCYIHGDPRKGTRRGIAMNGRHIAVIDSYLSDFKEVGADSQAILGWNGPGPFKIVNNYLEGAGENVMFGGGIDPAIPDLVPSDIEIRRNHFAKPLSWKIGDPSRKGIPWTVKNLFELKNARRVLVDGNLFEYNWAHAQNGFAILLTVRNQDGNAPWAVVEDVTFTNNVVRHTGSGVNILGFDDNHPSQQTKRILIRNNLFEDVDGTRWGGGGVLFQIIRGAADVVIEHNTALQTGSIVLAIGPVHTGFVFRHNIAPHNDHGIFGDNIGVGAPALKAYFPGGIVKKNVIAGGSAIQYPSDNFFPSSLDSVRFANRQGSNYRLASASRYKRAGSDGKDLGVDFDTFCAAMATIPQSFTYCDVRAISGKGK